MIDFDLVEKRRIIDLCLEDFKKMFPDTNRETQITLHLKLSLMSLEDLRLLSRDLINRPSCGTHNQGK